ncbi:MAG: phosphotransferase [Paludibacteraceae bacterium]|nr:phosphotransferase [Paludibacteraceae bacterium]
MPKQQGSNRIYTRETDADGRSVIRVVGTNRDENRAFIYMARHFHALGLPVPEIYWVSDDEMSYTQEDLGDTLLFDNLDPVLLERTIRALAHIQVIGAQDFDWSKCFPVPAFDERSIRWDLNYFKYCFLKGTKIEFSEPALENDFDTLVHNLLSTINFQLSTFLYRDFQSRNVMIRDGQPYFIDFQGGRRGPTQYDVASFLWQAKANFSTELREKLIEDYLDEMEKLSKTFDFQFSIFNWKASLPHFVLFRTLQVLGAYGYRGFFERKPHFLESIPLALKNLNDILQTLSAPTVERRSNDGRTTVEPKNTTLPYPELSRIAESLIAEGGLTVKRSHSTAVSQRSGLTVSIYSFSFKKGIPNDDSGNGGGYVFDCRSTHNPGKYDEFKALTGLDQPVIDFLEKDGEILTFLDSVYRLVDHHVERFLERDFTHLQVAFGCTGGQHRSVYCAEQLAKHLHAKYGVTIHLIHRERGIHRTLE